MENKPKNLEEILEFQQKCLEMQEEYMGAMVRKYNKNFAILSQEILDLQKSKKRTSVIVSIWLLVTLFCIYQVFSK